jgi:hypothetical protein
MVLNIGKEFGMSDRIRADGTYCFVSGPSYESMAECRFLRGLGGDSVGMSTLPEVIVARHCGMKVLGLSLITNKVILSKKDKAPAATHAEVLQAVEESGKRIEFIVKAFVLKPELKAYLAGLEVPTYDQAKSALLAAMHAPKTDNKIVNSSEKVCCDKNSKGICCDNTSKCCDTSKHCHESKCCTFSAIAHGVTFAVIGAVIATLVLKRCNK